jgi:hypothetical protein
LTDSSPGLHIEFCDGEDLMPFYWSFWTLVMVGSLVAILGIVMNQVYSIKEKEGPPWNVALGTPVLVLAGIGHAWHLIAWGLWRRFQRRRSGSAKGESRGQSQWGSEADETDADVDLEAGKANENETDGKKCSGGCDMRRQWSEEEMVTMSRA